MRGHRTEQEAKGCRRGVKPFLLSSLPRVAEKPCSHSHQTCGLLVPGSLTNFILNFHLLTNHNPSKMSTHSLNFFFPSWVPWESGHIVFLRSLFHSKLHCFLTVDKSLRIKTQTQTWKTNKKHQAYLSKPWDLIKGKALWNSAFPAFFLMDGYVQISMNTMLLDNTWKVSYDLSIHYQNNQTFKVTAILHAFSRFIPFMVASSASSASGYTLNRLSHFLCNIVY